MRGPCVLAPWVRVATRAHAKRARVVPAVSSCSCFAQRAEPAPLLRVLGPEARAESSAQKQAHRWSTRASFNAPLPRTGAPLTFSLVLCTHAPPSQAVNFLTLLATECYRGPQGNPQQVHPGPVCSTAWLDSKSTLQMRTLTPGHRNRTTECCPRHTGGECTVWKMSSVVHVCQRHACALCSLLGRLFTLARRCGRKCSNLLGQGQNKERTSTLQNTKRSLEAA